MLKHFQQSVIEAFGKPYVEGALVLNTTFCSGSILHNVWPSSMGRYAGIVIRSKLHRWRAWLGFSQLLPPNFSNFSPICPLPPPASLPTHFSSIFKRSSSSVKRSNGYRIRIVYTMAEWSSWHIIPLLIEFCWNLL